ncbi:membrane-associated protein, putative, partial [Bodo saltans]
MNTLRWTLLLTVLLTVLLLAFASSLTLLIQNALHDGSSPSYTSGDQLAWRRVSNTNTPANDDVVESASPVANTYHDFFSTTCQLRSAAFFTINGNQCYSIVYAINVPSWPLANGSQVSRQGYYGVSCDSPDMHCCGGVTRTQSEASSGNVLLPCWVSKDPSFLFVYFGLPPYSFFPSTMAIAMMAVSASTLLAFVIIIVVISRWTRAEEIRRQFAFYGRWIAKKTRQLLCIGGPLPTVRRIAVHGPTEGDTIQHHAMVTIHGNQMSIL